MSELEKLCLQKAIALNINFDLKQRNILHTICQHLQKKKFNFWPKKNLIKDIYLFGSVGTGKSTIVNIIYEMYQDAKLQMHFSTFMNFLQEELQQNKKRRNPLQYIVHKKIKNYKLLIIDEFEIFDIANAMILKDILHCILQEKTSIILISNLEPQQLYKDGLQREKFLPTIDLIQNKMKILSLNQDFDYRRLKTLNHEQKFFVNIDLQVKFAEIFQKCSPQILHIKNRHLKLPLCFSDVCFLNFEQDVCQQNMYSHDFAIITQKYKKIFIQKIPIFNIDNQDQCTRFIQFIDQAYINKTLLFWSGETKIQDLFQGNIKNDNFHRTISRLIEMQSFV